MKIGIYGNCQHSSYREVLAKMLPEIEIFSELARENVKVSNDCDIILYQSDYEHIFKENNNSKKYFKIPTFYFLGFHPDLIMERLQDGNMLIGAAGSLHSSIVLHGFLKGYSTEIIQNLFNIETYDILQYSDYWHRSVRFMTDNINSCGMDGAGVMRSWIKQGIFCHTANHPTIKAVEVICREILRLLHLKTKYRGLFEDPLQWHGTWPLYPGIAENHGAIGSLDFRFGELFNKTERKIIPLREFIQSSLDMYASQIDNKFLAQRFIDNSNYSKLGKFAKPARRTHAYSNLPDSSYWKKSISSKTIFEVDPVVSPRFKIKKTHKIITAGSCFAQHIAKKLTADGFNYHIAELPPAGMSSDEALKRGYGLFSARYGNVYTARQLRLLIERSLGIFQPADTAWQRPDGRWVDPYRPQLEPDGFESAAAVVEEATRHLACVRQMFLDADVFVFTLGLTECWIAKEDGAAFPTAPGIVAAEMDENRYAFVNFRVADVRDDLISAIKLIRQQNPTMLFILTVSPVPLVATFENKHVLTATTYSKSSLRAAVEEVVSMFDFIEYFPSYEIITGNYTMGSFFEADKREVNSNGVSKVMGLLQKHYFDSDKEEAHDNVNDLPSDISIGADFSREFARSSAIICDEELLDEDL